MDFQNKHRWLTPKAKTSKSELHGLGVVAVEQIKKSEIITVIGGIVVPRSEILEYRKRFGHIGIQIKEDFWICPISQKELEETGVFNHSCKPNIGYTDPITFVAIGDINPGEELVFDYVFGEGFFDSFECNCGAKNCRKTITQDDWKRKDLQEKYGEWFSPYLKDKVAGSTI